MKAKIQKTISKLPDNSGVYFFVGKKEKILYIGKATSLKNRVRSYFAGDILEKRSPLIHKMVEEATDIKFERTDSVLEALILEANLIKKHTPPYNTLEKDQKSWNYIVITDEDFPKVLIMRERDLSLVNYTLSFGPFPHGAELKEALKIVRKIFPYRDNKCTPNQGRPCFNRQIGLCPGVCTGEINKREYAKTIRHIKLFFEGKKLALTRSLRNEMKGLAKGKEFEQADKIKKKIFALQHIQDVALLKNNDRVINNKTTFRIEGFDVAHISGTSVVGVMTVIENGELKKSDYRKFKISEDKNDDVAALKEIISRRLSHNEWPYPDLIVVDGGLPQINITKAELERRGLVVPVVSVIKDERHKAREIIGHSVKGREREILLVNSEAHRFALKYHRNLRSRF